MSTYAIGDIQGCFDELQQLLSAMAFEPGRDRLWLVGDLVNRGPKSLETLRFVKTLGATAISVLGNHDLHLLAVAEGFARVREDDTLQAILDAPDRLALLHWLRSRPLLYREGSYVLVHAGLLPQWDVAYAASLAKEVERALQAEDYRSFLAGLYGSRPDRWRKSLQGMDRLRVVVNAMTRLRFCTAEGVMEFKTKGESHEAPKGYMPWFAVPGRKSSGEVLICGHWSALGVKLLPNLIAIDSGCVWGGKLTGIRLEDGQLFQADCAALPR